MITNLKRALWSLPAVAVILAVAASQSAVLAQPAYPSYAVPQEQTIRGTVSHFDGQYTMYVNDDRGYLDRVLLHQGTIINPTGIQLRSGFAVTVAGHPSGNAFIANEIDTPDYYYGHRYGYYPYYGPAIGIGLGFGRPYGWGGRGYYGRGWR